MPGRFAITSPPETLRAFFGYSEEPEFPQRYNIAPTQPIPVVTARAHSQGRERHFILMRWGFLPGFVKDPAKFSLLINARAETLTEKPSFRAAVKSTTAGPNPHMLMFCSTTASCSPRASSAKIRSIAR